MTDYIVFEHHSEALWREVGLYQARSARSAIQQAVKESGTDENGHRFAAVPSRSWRPVSVKVETKTALKFS